MIKYVVKFKITSITHLMILLNDHFEQGVGNVDDQFDDNCVDQVYDKLGDPVGV